MSSREAAVLVGRVGKTRGLGMLSTGVRALGIVLCLFLRPKSG